MNPAPTTNLMNIDIFDILGVNDSEGQKEELVKEMEQTIWQSVMDAQIRENLDDEDLDAVNALLDNDDLTLAQRQEQARALLLPKLPHLDDLLRQKTEEIKRGTLRQRIDGLMTFYRTNPAALQTVRMASDMFAQSRFADAVCLLNGIRA